MPQDEEKPQDEDGKRTVPLPADLIERVERWCANQSPPVTTATFVETAVRGLIERKELEEKTLSKKKNTTGSVTGG